MQPLHVLLDFHLESLKLLLTNLLLPLCSLTEIQQLPLQRAGAAKDLMVHLAHSRQHLLVALPNLLLHSCCGNEQLLLLLLHLELHLCELFANPADAATQCVDGSSDSDRTANTGEQAAILQDVLNGTPAIWFNLKSRKSAAGGDKKMPTGAR